MSYDWIAGDWSASGLRLWCMSGKEIVATRDSLVGLGDLDAGQHAAVLASVVPDRAAGVPVVLCGPVSGPGGWAEVAPVAVPAKLPLAPVAVDSGAADLPLFLIPGLAQGSPADLMRGAESRVAGFLALNSRFDGVVLVPGPVSTWVHVSAGEVVSFRSFLTGEMLTALAQGPSLRGRIADRALEAEVLHEAVNEGMGHPARVGAQLFSLAVESRSPEAARGRLLGLLLGQELAAARPYWLGQPVALIDGDPLCAAYAEALAAQHVPLLRADGARMMVEGLKAAHLGATA